MKKSIGGILAVFCLLMLLANPSLALSGARQGLLLWANVVLPTLLPFMICSGVIVAFDAIHILTGPFSPILSGILKLSEPGSYVFMSGLLCGYPMGAKTASDFLNSRRITAEEGRCLLAISNHPSPMFVFGYVMAQIQSLSGMEGNVPLWVVSACLYLPVLPLSFLAGKLYLKKRSDVLGSSLKSAASDIPETSFSFDSHMMTCFETMVRIGGYIMLFSILSLFLSSLPLHLSPVLRAALIGIAEITTGIQSIAQWVPGIHGAAMILGCAAFGGISGIFQTKSVIKNAGLSIRHYILWKLLHSFLSCILFYVLIRL